MSLQEVESTIPASGNRRGMWCFWRFNEMWRVKNGISCEVQHKC